MPRIPLRSTTGCTRCRLRRKKCGEEKPYCHNCLRHNLHCAWEDKGSKAASSLLGGASAPTFVVRSSVPVRRVARTKLEASPAAVIRGNGYVAFRDQAQFDFVIQSPRIFQEMLTKIIGNEFTDLSVLVTIAMQHEWTRRAVEAFAAFMAAQSDRPDASQHAVTMHRQAITDLRRRLDTLQPGAVDAAVLFTITCIGGFELLCLGDPEKVMLHFVAAAGLCSLIPKHQLRQPSTLLMFRITIESWLWNLSTLALFCTTFDATMRRIDWSLIRLAFDDQQSTRSCAHDQSPFLGGNHDIYRLILQATICIRSDDSLQLRREQASVWSRELSTLENRLCDYYTDLPHNLADLYFCKFALLAHALRIMLIKIADPDACPATEAVRAHVKSAQTIFSYQDVREKNIPTIAWSLVILLCAAHDQPTFQSLLETLQQISINFDRGHSLRFRAVIKAVRQCRSAWQVAESEAAHACKNTSLDLLADRGGILRASVRSTIDELSGGSPSVD